MTGMELVPEERIEKAILLIRGHKVMLDRDLAELYGVPTGRLNEQVRRNISRFPDDFMFQLTAEESASLRSQIAISKPARGGRRYLQNPNIKWTKDRGREPQRDSDEYPWFWDGNKFLGDRISDIHLTTAQKQAARNGGHG